MCSAEVSGSVVVDVVLFLLLTLLADVKWSGRSPAFFGLVVRIDADPDPTKLGMSALEVSSELMLAAKASGVLVTHVAFKLGVVGPNVRCLADSLFALGGGNLRFERSGFVVHVAGKWSVREALRYDDSFAVLDVSATPLARFGIGRRCACRAVLRQASLHLVTEGGRKSLALL